jgi:hypothetical protein
VSEVREKTRPRQAAREQRKPRLFRWIVVTVLVLASAGVAFGAATKDLAGLDVGAGKPRVEAVAPPSSAPTPSPTPTTRALARFDPTAPDDANLGLFKGELTKAASSGPSSSITGKVLTDALIAAGFGAPTMQRTADQTSANLQAPTLTVSVRLQKSCLVGQFVRSDASISTELTTPIETSACLIGQTIPVK